MLRKIFRTSINMNLAPIARAKQPQRQYTVEELKNNNWIFPDEDASVSVS
jgi:hypothetical protein